MLLGNNGRPEQLYEAIGELDGAQMMRQFGRMRVPKLQ